MAINAAKQSYIEYLMALRDAERALVRSYRDYASGEQTAQLTAEQIELLMGEDGKDPEFSLNVCDTIINVEASRLKVRGFTIDAPDDVFGEASEALTEQLTNLVSRWWKKSRMDEAQKALHYAAVRDGDAFLIPYYDNEARTPKLAVNTRYDDESAGVEMYYQDDNPAEPMAAVKIWTIERPSVNNTDTAKTRRLNVYYNDRIEKYISTQPTSAFSEVQWRPLNENDPGWDEDTQAVALADRYGNTYQAAVTWWTDNGQQTGAPLGVCVAHARRQGRGGPGGRSAIADVVPGLQDAINLSSMSLLAATVLAGFKVVVLTGVTADTTKIHLYPAAMIALEDPAASANQLIETDLRQLIEVKNSYIRDAAMLTNTPLSFFNLSGDIPAEGTQKQLEAGLLSKVEDDQVAIGNAYEDAIKQMIKLAIAANEPVGLALEQVDDLDIACDWEPADIRSESTDAEIAKILKELGIPKADVWRKLGYDEDKIAQMLEDTDAQRAQTAGELALAFLQAEQGNEIAQQQEQQAQPVAVAAGGNNGANAAAT